ncbi:hypothetical protein HDU97_009418 [Phlyctochytrium planicorne]|nr:hypothetical protein HDU97_009418 [Phlyctochytrium planicorne]
MSSINTAISSSFSFSSSSSSSSSAPPSSSSHTTALSASTPKTRKLCSLPTLALERICLYLPIAETTHLRKLCRTLRSNLISLPLARRQLRLFIYKETKANEESGIQWGKIAWADIDPVYICALLVDVGFRISAIQAAHAGIWDKGERLPVLPSITQAIDMAVSEGRDIDEGLEKTVVWCCLFPLSRRPQTTTTNPSASPSSSTTSISQPISVQYHLPDTLFHLLHNYPKSRKYLPEAVVILSAIGDALRLQALLHLFPETNLTLCGDLALRSASAFGHLDVVRVLFDMGPGRVNMFAFDDEAFREAVRRGHVGVVKALLESGLVERGCRDDEAIRVASASGDVEMVELLLTNGCVVDVGARNHEALRRACVGGHVDVVRMLVQSCGVLGAVGDLGDGFGEVGGGVRGRDRERSRERQRIGVVYKSPGVGAGRKMKFALKIAAAIKEAKMKGKSGKDVLRQILQAGGVGVAGGSGSGARRW